MKRAALLIGALAILAFALLTAPSGRPDFHFRERMLVSWASALLLIGAGAFLLETARVRERARGRWFFWEIAGWGFIYLAFDEHFQFHERAGALAGGSLGQTSVVNHLDDAIIMGYGLFAATWCWVNRGEIRLLWSGWGPVGLAAVCLVGTTAVDAFSPDTPPYRALEESLKLLAGVGFFLWAGESRRLALQISRSPESP